ncbi:SRPBCC family protein [Sandarakinorhabdus sp.]|uniref:SRPBCC family protein n=1 Tax=Sandarakinorhabdus sp. TaxID=1916663 RepID=UPI00286E4F33|nr:SRPBCC family protein [Sandarakinorhabdus sp.]
MTSITISTAITAPVERVWAAYTTPADITQWNHATDEWCCPSADVDLRVGGRYRAQMAAKDGSFSFDFEGVYTQIVPLQTLAYVLADGRQVQTSFETTGTQTRVATVFDAEDQHPIAQQREGWQAILDNFQAHVEAGPAR